MASAGSPPSRRPRTRLRPGPPIAAAQAAGLPPLKRTALSRRPDRVAESIMLGKGDKPVRAVNQKHTFGHVPGITVGFK